MQVFLTEQLALQRYVLSLAPNLLDASKDEFFRKFDNEADQADRDYDEFEIESENAGPVFQLIARYSF